MALPKPPSFRSERRTQTRIQVHIPVEISLPDRVDCLLGMNRDLSWGGACFLLPIPLARETGSMRISLPWAREKRLSAEARLLRCMPLGDGHSLVAVRFCSVAPGDQRRLEKLLNMLQASEVASLRRGPGGLVKELEVTLNEAAELRVMLAQIATGRLTVTVFDAYAPNQSISLLIAGATNLASIQLRACVAETRMVDRVNSTWPVLHTLLLIFEHPSHAIRDLVDFLLDRLPEAQDAIVPIISGVPNEWLCIQPIRVDSTNTSVQGDEPGSGTSQPSEFPHARRY